MQVKQQDGGYWRAYAVVGNLDLATGLKESALEAALAMGWMLESELYHRMLADAENRKD